METKTKGDENENGKKTKTQKNQASKFYVR